jgi:hypothetical protein
VTEDGDQVALAAGFDAEDAEAVLFIVEVTRSTSPARSSVGVLTLGGCGITV